MSQSPDILEITGQAVFGSERWRSPIAAHLRKPFSEQPGVSVRTIFHWLDGSHSRPWWLRGACVALLRQRAEELAELADRIEEGRSSDEIMEDDDYGSL